MTTSTKIKIAKSEVNIHAKATSRGIEEVVISKRKMMVNDTIVNARNFSDRLYNEVILWSNDFARDLGVTYGELCAGIN